MAEPKAPRASNEPYLQIGEVADRTGVTQRTLRFYEERGLLKPPSRMEGGFRRSQDAKTPATKPGLCYPQGANRPFRPPQSLSWRRGLAPLRSGRRRARSWPDPG